MHIVNREACVPNLPATTGALVKELVEVRLTLFIPSLGKHPQLSVLDDALLLHVAVGIPFGETAY